jgi:hypothetical protein
MTAPYTKEMQLQNKSKKPKRKRCKECNELFTPTRQMQPCCSMKCNIAYSTKNLDVLVAHGAKNRVKEANKKKTTWKQSDKSTLAEKMQKLANRYGRLREISRGNDFCVTCGAKNVKFDGGHFLPTSQYRPIRYYTLQINPQCVNCNQYNGGRPKEYRDYMIERFGLEKVEWLESHKQGDAKYTVEYYQKYLRVMGKRIKRYEEKIKEGI